MKTVKTTLIVLATLLVLGGLGTSCETARENRDAEKLQREKDERRQEAMNLKNCSDLLKTEDDYHWLYSRSFHVGAVNDADPQALYDGISDEDFAECQARAKSEKQQKTITPAANPL